MLKNVKRMAVGMYGQAAMANFPKLTVVQLYKGIAIYDSILMKECH